jgi:glyoxylase-like metal-dependent hydrolase (beta-lactamase superfamily II)
MSWYAIETISPGIRRITEPNVHSFFSANMFHVAGRDADLVIDFGMGLASLRDALALDPTKPVIAFATHAHVDHVGSLHEFDMRLGHAAEAEGFATMPDEITLAHLFRSLPDPVLRLPTPEWSAASYRLRPAPLTRLIGEGDLVDLGDRLFRVLHLPGHSPGGLALLDERDGTFFSGDAIYDGGLVDDLPGCDRIAYRGTMARLAGLDVAVAHGGHGDALSRERMQAIARTYLEATAHLA